MYLAVTESKWRETKDKTRDKTDLKIPGQVKRIGEHANCRQKKGEKDHHICREYRIVRQEIERGENYLSTQQNITYNI